MSLDQRRFTLPVQTVSAIQQARLAVETGVFPLYEVVNGKYRITVESQMRPIKDYLKIQSRFRHLSDDTIAQIQARVELEYKKLQEKANHGSKTTKRSRKTSTAKA